MSSLNNLWWKLKYLDLLFPESQLDGLSYEWTYNETLGLKPGDASDFSVFIPFKQWPKTQGEIPKETKFPSALQEAFVDVLQRGSVDKSTCLIDITSLNLSDLFFTQPEDIDNTEASATIKEPGKCLARSIADVVNAANTNTTPVIRILCGTESSDHAAAQWSSNRSKFEKMFWRKGRPIITHQKAVLQIGYYSPAFETNAPGVSAWISQLIASVDRILKHNADRLKIMDNSFDPSKLHLDKMIGEVLTGEVPSISWNHAKLLAVNGQAMMTGGGNYWNEYIGGAHAIVDHQVKIKGDAAISAHKYCDYFWRYLNKDHPVDEVSFRRSIPLNTVMPDDSKWSTGRVLDQNPYKMSLPKTKIPVLTVGRLGDWHGNMNALQYPVQMVDAARDILLNALWYMNSALTPALHGKIMYEAQFALHDDPKTELTLGAYRELKVNPLAWASRIARYETIANAQKSVHVSQQMLVDTLQNGNEKYVNVVKSVNKYIEDKVGKGLPQWDGSIWPYDMFVAFGWALNSIKKNNGEGIYLILTTHQAGALPGGWEDKTSVKEFIDRLKIIMKGMKQSWVSWSGGWVVEENEVDKLVDDKFHVMRTLKDNGDQYCHNKIVVVDRKLMYVGSDNMYPCYNEEHGVWIEHKPTIDAWYTKFWDSFKDWSSFAKD